MTANYPPPPYPPAPKPRSVFGTVLKVLGALVLIGAIVFIVVLALIVSTAQLASASGRASVVFPAQYAGQQVCRSASTSSDNDGGVRVYGAGYEQHPEQFYDLPRGRCWTFTTAAEARYADVQLRGSGSARWRITTPSPDGPWHAFTGTRSPQPIADTYAHTVIEVDR